MDLRDEFSPDELLAAAQAMRPGMPLTERRCATCRGSGIGRVRDANAPTGHRESDPCEACDGFGMYWQVRDTQPAIYPKQAVEWLRKNGGA